MRFMVWSPDGGRRSRVGMGDVQVVCEGNTGERSCRWPKWDRLDAGRRDRVSRRLDIGRRAE